MIKKLRRKLNIGLLFVFILLILGSFNALYVWAATTATSNFTQTINPGSLSIDIVNGSYVTVGSPTMAMSAATFDFSCQTITGSFGTASEQIYIKNPDAADNGWTVTIAASSPTAKWDSAGTDFDFNEAGSSGCVDDGATTDADALGGQMTVDPSGATLAQGASSHGTSGLSLGSSFPFVEGSRNTITLLTSDGTTDIGDWTLRAVAISQKIPAEQPAASDYDINMVVDITAS